MSVSARLGEGCPIEYVTVMSPQCTGIAAMPPAMAGLAGATPSFLCSGMRRAVHCDVLLML